VQPELKGDLDPGFFQVGAHPLQMLFYFKFIQVKLLKGVVRFEVTPLCLLALPTLEVDFNACLEIGDRVESSWL
jgi:hypothetical protein